MVQDKNEIQIHKCRTWDQFVTAVRKPHNLDEKSFFVGRGIIFRGHSNPKWKLWSTLERNTRLQGKAIIEGNQLENPSLQLINGLEWYDAECSNILESFRKSTRGMPDINGEMGVAEMWTVGRHHGLLSPYLDWTGSPYIAAFFALEKIYQKLKYWNSCPSNDRPNEDVHVWGLRLMDVLQKQDEFEVVEAETWHSTRQRAQLSWFTKLRSKDHIELEGYLTSRSLACCLERYDLSPAMWFAAFRDLDLMGINYLSLFPDLSGAAWNANVDPDRVRLLSAAQYRVEKDVPE